jgi:anaerobic selenocysteine-containing dehydrogenase
VYTAPADLNFEALLEKTIGSKTTVVHLGSHFDETAQYATWHIPQAHFLETWSDARAYDGTVSIVQPMIAPLYGGKSAHEIVQVMLEEPYLSPRDAVRANWPQLKDEQAWRKALQQGWIDGTAFTGERLGKHGQGGGECRSRGGWKWADGSLPAGSVAVGRTLSRMWAGCRSCRSR